MKKNEVLSNHLCLCAILVIICLGDMTFCFYTGSWSKIQSLNNKNLLSDVSLGNVYKSKKHEKNPILQESSFNSYKEKTFYKNNINKDNKNFKFEKYGMELLNYFEVNSTLTSRNNMSLSSEHSNSLNNNMSLSYKSDKSEVNIKSRKLEMNRLNSTAEAEGNQIKSVENRVKAFPNSYESLTSKKDFNNTKFQAPKLSDALQEFNPKIDIKKEKFLEIIKFSLYKLSRGELEQVFNTIDTEQKDLINQNKWDDFRTLFILPFEACDEDNNYLLDKKELEKCLKAEPKMSFVDLRQSHKNDFAHKLMTIISSREDFKVNFFNYLFLKRTLYAWRHCQNDRKYISLSSFKCAMEVVTKMNRKIYMNEIYNIALKYQFNDMSLVTPDFLCFLNIANISYYFSIISYPSRTEFIEKQTFIKAVREERLPIFLVEKDIELFYELININVYNNNIDSRKTVQETMNFNSFCFFWHFNKIFNKYSSSKTSQLTQKEFLEMLNDPMIPPKIINSIDSSITLLQESVHLEGSLIHQVKRPNEGIFFNSFMELKINKKSEMINKDKKLDKDEENPIFLERAHKSHEKLSAKLKSKIKTKVLYVRQNKISHSLSKKPLANKDNSKASYYFFKKNKANREVFFTIFRNFKQNVWDKKVFFRAFQFSNLFTTFLKNDHYYRVSVTHILKNLDKAYLEIYPNLVNKFASNTSKIILSLPIEIKLDILTYLGIEYFYEKIKTINAAEEGRVNEIDLKLVMKDFGMGNIPDTVLDIAARGKDSLNRRVFDLKTLANKLFINQATSVEILSDEMLIKEKDLKPNSDPSRKFPQDRRRFLSSPLV